MFAQALAAPQLSDNPWLVGGIFIFILLSVFSLGPNGVLRMQMHLLFDTRNSRTFEVPSLGAGTFRPLLLLQTFLFEGLCLYYAVCPRADFFVEAVNMEGLRLLLFCLLLPVGWFLFQWFCFNWTGYLSRGGASMFILNRSFLAVHLLLGPWCVLLFLAQMAGYIDTSIGAILLTVLFGLSQTLFIFSGIKIFFNGIATLCFIIIYLCTLEIAPLYILLHKMMP